MIYRIIPTTLRQLRNRLPRDCRHCEARFASRGNLAIPRNDGACQAKSGFILVTVLIITAVGLLFGAGSLLLFRFQCQLRIDRQHELEKLYAVRSVLNYIRIAPNKDILDTGKPFQYHTGSERNLRLLAKPSARVFPDPTNEYHLVISKKASTFNDIKTSDYRTPIVCEKPDYVCGAEGATNLWIANNNTKVKDGYGLVFPDLSATNNVKWWVNVGMPGTGGWLQESYGRRYYFQPREYVSGASIKDVMRFCIIRDPTNDTVGCGWPLSSRERALVFQISPKGDSVGSNDLNNAEISLFELVCDGGFFTTNYYHHWVNCPSFCPMGVQIAGSKISLFYISNGEPGGATSGGYTFSDVKQLTTETYNYFADGSELSESGEIVRAPDLRVVFEVEAASDARNGTSASSNGDNPCDHLTDFCVTKAYQYDVYLEYPVGVMTLATVAQKVGEYDSRSDIPLQSLTYTVLTYDTHGTQHKGFRRDEREAERKGGR